MLRGAAIFVGGPIQPVHAMVAHARAEHGQYRGLSLLAHALLAAPVNISGNTFPFPGFKDAAMTTFRFL